jgi:hypothetical protein
MKRTIAVAMSDLHRTDKRPICRKELSPSVTQNAKLWQIVEIAQLHKVPLLCAGDVYDDKDCGFGLVFDTRNILKDVDFRACYGQHELHDHDISQYRRSPLSQHTESNLNRASFLENAELHFCSWGEAVPRHADNPNWKWKILVIHKMVYLGAKPFPNAKGNVKKLIQRPEFAQYDLIISGDNHVGFVYSNGKTTWLNCGCVYRTASNERDYTPRCFLIQTEDDCISVLEQPLKYKLSDVSEEHLEDAKIEKECSKEFAMSLADLPIRKKSSYADNVQRSCKKEQKSVRKKINKFLGA